jgi:DNA-binding CsgD family transcriptional regulator
VIALRIGDGSLAAARQEEALAILTDLGRTESWAACAAGTVLGNLGNVAVAQGNMVQAKHRFTESLAALRALGYARGITHVSAGLGDVARGEGDQAEALRCYREALALGWAHGETRAIGYALGGVAATLAGQGQWEAAARLFGAAEAYHETVGMPFALETFDRQRALGLPEPWLRAHDSFGVEQGLRDALRERRTVPLSSLPDPAEASRRWVAGRLVPIEEAVADALAVDLDGEGPAAAPRPEDAFGLSPRELEVLRLLVEGRTDREIAGVLCISTRTAEKHVRAILGKLDAPTRTAAAAIAVRRGLA